MRPHVASFSLVLATMLINGFAHALSPAEDFGREVIRSLDHALGNLAAITAAADSAATRLVSGGRIYVTDDETIFRTGTEKTTLYESGGYQYPMHEDWGGFVAEACDRAGGLRHIQPVPVDGKVGPKDVILVGTLDLRADAQIEHIRSLRRQGALVVLFGSGQSRLARAADFLVDNGLPPGVNHSIRLPGGLKTGPVAGIANVANMWAFTAELVAASTRRGKMPTMYQSMMVVGAARRNQEAGAGWFYPNLTVQPIPAGELGRRFLEKTKGYMTQILDTELRQFQEAGKLCSEAINSKRKVVASVIGHFMTTQTRMPGYLPIFDVIANQYGAESLRGRLQSADVWVHVGYSFYPLEEINYVRSTGAKLMGVLSPGPTAMREGTPVDIDTSLFDVYIDPYWRFGDGAIEIPGYDVAIIPVSGVVMISTFWMILSETAARLDSIELESAG